MSDNIINNNAATESGDNTAKVFNLKDVYYYHDTRTFFWPEYPGWKGVPQDAARRLLRAEGYSTTVEPGEKVSALDRALNQIQMKQSVSFAGTLAGYHAQALRSGGQTLLVTSSPELIGPVQGECIVLRMFLSNLLGEQVTYLYGWLKVSLESLTSGKPRAGQMLALAGPPGCGKSFLQNLITKMFGGRSAKPYMYLIGQTAFNSDLFEGEHLMIEDEAASSDFRARRKFGAEMKQITANETARFHPKGRPGILLKPFWRLSASLNDEPENLAVLPVLDESVKGKIILLRATANAVPWPTRTEAERVKFLAQVHSELPAFVWFLENWTIPEKFRDGRYGISSYLHPELVEAIDGLSPEAKLWELIQSEMLKTKSEWTGTTRELARAITTGSSEFEARQILTYPNACGTYLSRLASKKPYSDSITATGGKNAKRWRIVRDRKPDAQ